MANTRIRTTTELTTSFAASIANLIGLGSGGKAVEIVIRAVRLFINYFMEFDFGSGGVRF